MPEKPCSPTAARQQGEHVFSWHLRWIFRCSLTVSLLFLSIAPSFASFKQRDAGTNAAQFLKLGADARAAAMGQAVSALAEDATAVHWNPAGLADLQEHHATFSHGAHLEGVFYDFAAYAQPVDLLLGHGQRAARRDNPYGSIGVALFYLNAGRMREVDNTGADTGQDFTPQEFAGTVAWGGSVTRALDIGIGAKFIYSKIHASAQTAAGAVGARLHVRPLGKPLTLSFGAHNFGGAVRFTDKGQELPFYVNAGASVRPLKNVILTGELVAPRDNRVYGATGIELRADVGRTTSVMFRAGYNGMNYYDDLIGLSTLTAGGGFRMGGFELDYAWIPYGVLRDAHRFTVSYRL